MSNVRMFYCDDETGEVITYSVNVETGEPKVEGPPLLNIQPRQSPTRQVTHRYMKFPRGYMSKTKKFQSLKANILAGSNTVSQRMIIIPAMLICPSLICILLMVLEIYLHVYCHLRNKELNDTEVYYQSPFHMITSTFCGVCRENDSASKIGQMQDQRRVRYDYFRGIAI